MEHIGYDFSYHQIKHPASHNSQNDPDPWCWANDFDNDGLHDHLKCSIEDLEEWFKKNGVERYITSKKFLKQTPTKRKTSYGKQYITSKSFAHHYKKEERERISEKLQKSFNDPDYQVGKHYTMQEVFQTLKNKIFVERRPLSGQHKYFTEGELRRWNRLCNHIANSSKVDLEINDLKVNMNMQYQKNMSDDEWKKTLPSELVEKLETESKKD